LIDKKHAEKELVRTIAGRAINDLGGNRTGTVNVTSSGPVSTTLRAVSSTPIAHTTDVTLYRDIDRIDISNTITANFGDVKTWAYSFNLNSPDVWHEEVGAVIRARLVGTGGHYSPRNARYDWLTMNHFADIADGLGNYGVTISNWDDYFMKLGGSNVGALDIVTPQINVLAGGQVDGSDLGIPDQNGDSRFTQRFALRSHEAFDQSESMKMAMEHQNPFIAGMIETRRSSSRPYPATTYSFLTISDPNVLLWALKPAEDGIGRGIITRVWNQSDAPLSFTLTLARPLASADKVTHIETSIAPAEVSSGKLVAPIDQQQIQTHLLRLK
jgi:alpha-mannosidase